jgi:uncharacterized membrane protein YdjX (TVP38/TMEM64 family)
LTGPLTPTVRSDEQLGGRVRGVLRLVALVLWAIIALAFWFGARQAGVNPVAFLLGGVEALAAQPWAPAGVLLLYLARPLLLLPITVANLAAGFVLGPFAGLALALGGTLASASVGYTIGRTLGSESLAQSLPARWRVLRVLRRRTFESVVAGGLMYLHADAVNLPAGLMRVPFPLFLAGIAVGNALTMTSAVLAGSSVDGDLSAATVQVDVGTLALALTLFTLSLLLASWLRRRNARVEASSRYNARQPAGARSSVDRAGDS